MRIPKRHPPPLCITTDTYPSSYIIIALSFYVYPDDGGDPGTPW